MQCKTHGIGFTLYPPGYFPYGRKPIAPVGLDGYLLTQDTGAERFVGTYFEAAIDAAKGRFWPAESLLGNCEARYQTQTRHINRTLSLLGLDPQLDDKQREAIGYLLDIPGQSLHDRIKSLTGRNSYRLKGLAICDILDQITPGASILERIAEVGAIVDLWPTPFSWYPHLNRLLPMSFRITRTRASPG